MSKETNENLEILRVMAPDLTSSIAIGLNFAVS